MNLAHDDDGIIDLRALKSTPPPAGAFAAFGHFPMASPFGSEPPPAAFARDAGSDSGSAGVVPARMSKAKAIGIAAGAAFFVILSAVGVGFAFRGEKPANVASASVTPSVAAPPVVTAPPAPAADPPAAPAAATPADDTSAAADAPPAKKTKGAKGARSGAAKARTSAAASSPAVSKPAATKAADPCHCHGDFQCNIRCSANR